jgi:hypothetical protein
MAASRNISRSQARAAGDTGEAGLLTLSGLILILALLLRLISP